MITLRNVNKTNSTNNAKKHNNKTIKRTIRKIVRQTIRQANKKTIRCTTFANYIPSQDELSYSFV